jgi:hypothetical protein
VKLELVRERPNQIALGLIYSGLVLVILIGIAGVSRIIIFRNLFPGLSSNPVQFYICPFKAITGLPCLTCGTTRAMLALAQLNISHAIKMNPLICLSVFMILAWGLYEFIQKIFRTRYLTVRVTPCEHKMIIIGIIIAITANWYYLIKAGI